MATLTKDAILGMDDLPRKEVFVPEWKGSVYVRALTGAEWLSFNALVNASTDDPTAEAKVVALCAVDAEGNQLFTLADVEALSAKSGRALSRVALEAALFNLGGAEALEEGKGD